MEKMQIGLWKQSSYSCTSPACSELHTPELIFWVVRSTNKQGEHWGDGSPWRLRPRAYSMPLLPPYFPSYLQYPDIGRESIPFCPCHAPSTLHWAELWRDGSLGEQDTAEEVNGMWDLKSHRRTMANDFLVFSRELDWSKRWGQL